MIAQQKRRRKEAEKEERTQKRLEKKENKENKRPIRKKLFVVCMAENDSGEKRGSWVQCDTIGSESWVHLKCIPPRIVSTIDQGNSFFCPTCQWVKE